MKLKKKSERLRGVAVTEDPVEIHILEHIDKLRQQNKRLKEHIDRTGVGIHIKDVDEWKPFDFYKYFCVLYRNKYNREYKQHGSVVLTYQKIEAFKLVNKIENANYKEFIERAFSHHFNAVTVPVIGNMCSARLFTFLMHKKARLAGRDDLHSLDMEILKETQEFDEAMQAIEFNSGMSLRDYREALES
jgi:hypothetical protein